MSTIGTNAAKSTRIVMVTLGSCLFAGFMGCAGGTYNNCPGYTGYPYNVQPGQYPQTLPYTNAPQLPMQPGSVLPQTNVLPQGQPQVNATAPVNNIVGAQPLQYGYPIGTVPQAAGAVPMGTYQPGAYTAANPYPNSDASTRPYIGWR